MPTTTGLAPHSCVSLPTAPCTFCLPAGPTHTSALWPPPLLPSPLFPPCPLKPPASPFHLARKSGARYPHTPHTHTVWPTDTHTHTHTHCVARTHTMATSLHHANASCVIVSPPSHLWHVRSTWPILAALSRLPRNGPSTLLTHVPIQRYNPHLKFTPHPLTHSCTHLLDSAAKVRHRSPLLPLGPHHAFEFPMLLCVTTPSYFHALDRGCNRPLFALA